MLNYIKYLEIPYVEDGRGWDGCDCYGIFMLWYKSELNIDIYDFQLPRACKLSVRKLEKMFDEFSSVAHPQRHDIVLIDRDDEVHVGVCISDKEFLHAVKVVGGAVSELKDWKKHTTGFYRHKSLIEE